MAIYSSARRLHRRQYLFGAVSYRYDMRQSQYQIFSTSHDAWDAMYQALLSARKSIFWEVYTFIDDDVGRRFARLLEQKAREGVVVRLVVDALGSYGLSHDAANSLRAAGVDLRIFHERKRRRGWWRLLWSRTHRKILIVDEAIGFIGGVNVEAVSIDWLDIHVRVEGVIVHSLIRSFARMYVLAGGNRRVMREYVRFPYRFRRTKADVELIDDPAHQRFSRLRKTYVDALLHARERVILFSPYYFPDKNFLFALWKARRRGVKIDLLLPLRTDIRLATYAAYACFSLLQSIGVNIRLTPTMMHGKGMIVDDEYSIVGSGNLDQTSFYDNYEASLAIRNKQFARRLRKTVDAWMEHATLLDMTHWKGRGKLQRLKEWVALKLYRIWHKY